MKTQFTKQENVSTVNDQPSIVQVDQIEIRYFPQFKAGKTWIFSLPVRRPYGYKTIEECESFISEMEELSKEEGIPLVEFRIVEVMV